MVFKADPEEAATREELTVALAPGTIDGGGIGTVTLNLAEGLRDQGVSVDLLLTSEPAGLRTFPEGVGVKVLGSRTRNAFGAACRYLSRTQPDAIVSARNYMHLLMSGALRATRQRSRCTHIWTYHTHRSTELSGANLKTRLIDAVAVGTMPAADHLVAVSRGVAEDLEANLRLPRGRVGVIPNPAWRPRYLQEAEAPSPHFWIGDGGPPIILGVGRLVPQKDFSTLMRGFAKLDQPARLAILGEGPERKKLEALAVELGIGDRVILPGQQASIFPWLSRVDLFVLSSRWEGLPTVLVEALGFDCPIVATDCPSGPAEILANEPRCRLVPVGEPTELAKAMGEALRKGRGPKRHGAPLERFSVDTVAASYLRLVKQPCGHARARRPGQEGR